MQGRREDNIQEGEELKYEGFQTLLLLAPCMSLLKVNGQLIHHPINGHQVECGCSSLLQMKETTSSGSPLSVGLAQ